MFDKKLSQQIRFTNTFLQLTKEITAQCDKTQHGQTYKDIKNKQTHKPQWTKTDK